MSNDTRYHFMDNLRAHALLLGIFYHAALAYSPFMHNLWFTSDAHPSYVFDLFSHWLHLFRMPVFFVIAGFFAHFLLNAKGSKAFLWHRTKRIALPFLIFLPLLTLAFVVALKWAASTVTNLPAIFSAFSHMKDPQLSSMHLWFLWNLFGFCLVFALLWQRKMILDYPFKLLSKPISIIVLLPFIISCSLYFQYVPFSSPDKLRIELWSYGFYGVFFLFGASLYTNLELLEKLKPYAKYLFIIGVVSYSVYVHRLPEPMSIEKVIHFIQLGEATAQGTEHLLTVLVQSVSVVSWSLLAIVLAYQFMAQTNALCRYISDASYWVYLIHFPVLMFVQIPLIDASVSVFVKYTISVLITLLICFLSYFLFVRHTFIGLFLNGKKY
ncbi:acyltransferase family protein [Pseudoalteromonas sp. JBTF-M23]|uniref:Acyltransferase family protein n=1 Tax=Pseudoalteromonas caenipelagi TaxID=2726988 RepID=A0A849V8X2_9GAMM|nr:acyltransferase family protein [Pseudoalteromonas caenipelagi]NOU50019.1 acyltransferase family protein [Pseudoalteromonas caenipelagi]